MLSESPLRDNQRSPSSSHSPWQNGSPSPVKGKKPMYSPRPAGYPQDPQPAGQSQDGLDLTLKPSLLSRMSPTKQPLSARIRSPDHVAHTSSLVERIAAAAAEEGELPPDEGEDSPVASGDLQGTPQARPTVRLASVHIKAEETIAVIPSPASTDRLAGRKRGSRSTIDVFGNPMDVTDSPENEGARSPVRPPERENTFNGSGTIPVDIGQGLDNQSHIDTNSSIPAMLSLGSSNQNPSLAPSVPAMSPPDSLESVFVGNRPITPAAIAVEPTHPVLSAPSAPYLHLKPSLPLPPAVLEQCRNLMIPLIDRNAKLRKPGVDEALVKQRALALLSDDKCAEIVRLAREVRKQMQGGQKRHREGSDQPPEPPAKVPRVDSETAAIPIGEDRMLTRSPSPLMPGAAADTIMAVDTESHAVEVPTSSPIPGSSFPPQQPHTAQSPPPTISPLNPDMNARTDPYPDIRSTEGNTDVKTSLPSSDALDLPPATRTARSRTPSEHASEPARRASSSSTTTPGPETRPITSTAPPRNVSPMAADSETVAQVELTVLSTTTDASRNEEDMPHLYAYSENQPVAQPSENLDDDSMSRRSQDPPEQPPAPSLVPGLWAALGGRPSPGIEKIEFFVDDATADATRCWAQRHESFSLDDRHVAVHLLCLSQVSVRSVVDNLGPSATPADIVAALWDIKSDWPPQGSLVVQASPASQKDPSCPVGRAWLPLDLPDAGHLDITSCIGPGKNAVNLIQLQGMSDHFFALHATEPSQAQRETASAEMLAWSHLSKWTPQSPRPPMPFQRTLYA